MKNPPRSSGVAQMKSEAYKVVECQKKEFSHDKMEGGDLITQTGGGGNFSGKKKNQILKKIACVDVTGRRVKEHQGGATKKRCIQPGKTNKNNETPKDAKKPETIAVDGKTHKSAQNGKGGGSRQTGQKKP